MRIKSHSSPTSLVRYQRLFFESPDSFYKVLLVKVSQTNLDWRGDEIVVTGNFADVTEEMPYRFFGKLVEHPKYGQQFQAENYQNEAPTTKEGIVQYLSGDDFPGLGKKNGRKDRRFTGLDGH